MKLWKFYSTLLIISFLASCRPDPALPAWDIEALTPLANSRLDVGDIFQDSSLNTNADGSLSIVYTADLAQLKPDEVIRPVNANFSNRLNLAGINLGTPKFSDYISLGDIARGGSPAGQFIIANNGVTTIAPPILNVGPKAFDVNASSIFQDIELLQGEALLVFENNLPVAVTDIDFRLENKSNGLLILQAVIDTIKAQETFTRSFDLAGKRVEGSMRAIMQSFNSPGSGSQNVLIDTSDRVVLNVTLDNLVPSSATAIFPDQVLAKDTNYTDPLQAGDALLTSIAVESGLLYLDAASTVEDIIKLNYQIPGASLGGTPISIDEQIPAASSGGVANSYSEFDISGYTIDLTGQPGDVGVYNQFYTILSGRIDSSGNLINLSTSDSIFLGTGVIDLTASRGFGYLGMDTLSVQESNPIALFDIIQGGSFDLDEARLGVGITNYIGAPIELKIKDMTASKGSSQQGLVWDQLGQFITISAANIGPQVPIPSYLEIEFNKVNSNFDQLIELQPQQFMTDIEAIINGATPAPIFNQFIYTQYGVQSELFLEVPLNLSFADLKFTDTVDFNYQAFDPDRQVQDGILKVLASNYFPIDAQITLVMLDELGQTIDSLTSSEMILAPSLNTEGKPTEAKKSIANYPLNDQGLAQLFDTRQMLIVVEVNSANQPQKVRLFEDNYLDLSLTADLRIRSQ